MMPLRYRELSICAAAIAVTAIGGCGFRGNTELLEARLREQDRVIAGLRSELSSVRSEHAATQRETESLRWQLADHSREILLPEQTTAVARLERIRFHSLMTGLLDREPQGQQTLNIVLQPLDHDDDLVKLSGDVMIELMDLSRPDGQRLLDRWEIPREQALDYWTNGAVADGFAFQYPLSGIGDTNELLLHARFTTVDGRQFDTSSSIQAGGSRVASQQIAN